MINAELNKCAFDIEEFNLNFNIDVHSIYQMYISAYLANDKSTFEQFIMSEVQKIISADVARKGYKRFAVRSFSITREDNYFKVFGKVIVNK